MANFALVGSSYIERLRRFSTGDLHVPGTIKWFGLSGIRIQVFPRPVFSSIVSFKPDCVFVHMGGNDITTSTTPRDVSDRLLKFRERLLDCGVKRVYMAEILPRGDFSRSPDQHLDKAIFDRKRKKINNFLKSALGQYFVSFKDIKFPEDYDSDMVHLGTMTKENRASGMTRYFHRVRRIFLGHK